MPNSFVYRDNSGLYKCRIRQVPLYIHTHSIWRYRITSLRELPIWESNGIQFDLISNGHEVKWYH